MVLNILIEVQDKNETKKHNKVAGIMSGKLSTSIHGCYEYHVVDDEWQTGGKHSQFFFPFWLYCQIGHEIIERAD